MAGKLSTMEALQLSEARLRRAELASKSGNWEIHVDTNQVHISEGAAILYGLNKTQFDYSYIKEIPLHEYRPVLDAAYIGLVEHGKPYDVEFKIKKVDSGEIIDIHSIATFDKEKKILFGTIQDISSGKKREAALRESEEKYRFLYESIKIPISIFDSESLKFLSVNSAFIEKYGYSEEEFLNMTILEIRPETEIQKVKESVKLKDEGLVNVGVFLHKKKNGDIIQVEIIRHDIIFNGREAKLVFVNDVTDKIKIENELLSSEKQLRKLNADKDRFISILAHDLKGPSNNLLGLAELLTKNIRNYNFDKIELLLNQVYIAARTSHNLLDDLLVWARNNQGSIDFKPQNQNLADICNEVLMIIRPTANEKAINIDYIEENMSVFADKDMLKTILRNLLTNAVKFTNRGGEVSIKAVQNSENTTITVLDNGIGISADTLKNLFDISNTFSTKGTANETGTGLGLILCKTFVEKHHGKIWVESKPGKGSEFKFTLPCSSVPS